MSVKKICSLALVLVVLSLSVLPACAKVGTPKLDYGVNSKSQVITAVYKAYGTPKTGLWLTKVRCKNTGEGPMYDLKVSYKIPEYIDWISNNPYPKVIPGETIVDCFYPSFPASISKLSSKTPSNLMLKITYNDAAGKSYEESSTVSIELLSKNDFISTSMKPNECLDWRDFNSNVPLLAAFVTPQDQPLRDFADLANKLAGGIGAASSDQNALTVIEACFQTMHNYGITYKHPTADLWAFEVLTQHIQYPRDTIRENSGTCVDLAILLAAMAECLGLRPYLFVLPGHAIPVIGLPGGNLIPVESTLVGELGQQYSFQQAVQIAQDEVNEAIQKGQYYLVDVKQMREMGVGNPELPELPADILNTWLRTPAQPKTPLPTQTPPQPPGPTPQGLPTYTDSGGRFSIAYPPGWIFQVLQSGGNQVQWTSPDGAATILVAVNLFTGTATSIYDQYAIYLKQYYPDFQTISIQDAKVGQYPAVLALTRATVNGMLYNGAAVAVASANNGFILECACPNLSWDAYNPTFTHVLNSFMIR